MIIKSSPQTTLLGPRLVKLAPKWSGLVKTMIGLFCTSNGLIGLIITFDWNAIILSKNGPKLWEANFTSAPTLIGLVKTKIGLYSTSNGLIGLIITFDWTAIILSKNGPQTMGGYLRTSPAHTLIGLVKTMIGLYSTSNGLIGPSVQLWLTIMAFHHARLWSLMTR